MPLTPATKTKQVRPKKCAVKACRQQFKPARSFINWCSPECGRVLGEQKLEKQKALEAKREALRVKLDKQDHRAKLEYSKPLAWHINRARKACHDYIKARDYGKPCICCGEPIDWNGDKMQIHAGHWRTQGSSGQIRFDEDNIHAQRAYCNKERAGNQSAMREGMVRRIGEDRVKALEARNEVKNWTREELLEVTLYYRAKLKELKANETGKYLHEHGRRSNRRHC